MRFSLFQFQFHTYERKKIYLFHSFVFYIVFFCSNFYVTYL